MMTTGVEGLVITKSSQLKKQAHNFELVSFSKHKKNKLKNDSDELRNITKDPVSVDMKKARFEVYKFSKSDLNFSNRQKSNVDLAIQLGARPPKNEAKNYKKLKEEKREEAVIKEETKYFKEISRNFKMKMDNRAKTPHHKLTKSKQNGILNAYGKYTHREIPYGP
ncbi:Bardet-Biedl syndrome 5 protein [Homalodisca vitripennis]|nr:Bardet-Biedl syndrome 5 protein [Homalodisca vitripennis]